MNKILKSYKDTTAIVNYDLRAGADISAMMSVNNLAELVEKEIQMGGIGNSVHASLILAKKLNEEGISSSFIYTGEPYELGGREVMGNRVSVLYKDPETNEYFVANPVEDAELFTLLELLKIILLLFPKFFLVWKILQFLSFSCACNRFLESDSVFLEDSSL